MNEDEEKRTQVRQQIVALEKAIVRHHDLIGEHTTYLGPILKSVEGDEGVPPINTPKPMLVPLAAELAALTDRVQAASERIQSLISRNEL